MLKTFFYSLIIYLRRLKFYSFLYFVTLFVIIIILGLSLYFIERIGIFSEKIKEITPENRVKIVLKDEGVKKKGENVFSFFSRDKIVKREKNFITPDLVRKIKSIGGVRSIAPLYNIDFPVSVYFSMPGSSTYFNAEVVGIGILPSEAKKFVVKSDFVYKSNDDVPVLVASYLIEVFNSILEANNIPIKITKENIVGFTFNLAIGSSFIGGGKPLETIRCKVVGFIDLDYTMGLALPASLIAKYKKNYWSNFKDGYFDFLMSYIDIKDYNKIESELDKLGLKIKKSDNIFNKVADIINTVLSILKTTMTLLFFVIGALGIIGVIYTLIFMLRGRKTEFYIYNFFGGLHLSTFLFWGYITLLNIIVVIINYFLLDYASGFVSGILSSVDIYGFVELDRVIKSVLSYNPDFGIKYSIMIFIVFEVIVLFVIYLYNLFLVKKEV